MKKGECWSNKQRESCVFGHNEYVSVGGLVVTPVFIIRKGVNIFFCKQRQYKSGGLVKKLGLYKKGLREAGAVAALLILLFP